MKFIKKEAEKELESIYGWRSYPQKHFESKFTKFFEGYWLPTRFGYDMRKNQLSSLILSKQITREEALKVLNSTSYDQQDIENEKIFIANKLNISTDELDTYHKMPLKYFWNYKNIKKIFDIGEKLIKFFDNSTRGGAY